jgi:hypothetical protein
MDDTPWSRTKVHRGSAYSLVVGLGTTRQWSFINPPRECGILSPHSQDGSLASMQCPVTPPKPTHIPQSPPIRVDMPPTQDTAYAQAAMGLHHVTALCRCGRAKTPSAVYATFRPVIGEFRFRLMFRAGIHASLDIYFLGSRTHSNGCPGPLSACWGTTWTWNSPTCRPLICRVLPAYTPNGD